MILKHFKLSFQHLDRFCTGGQLEVAVVVLINGNYNVNFHRERKPEKCNLMSFSVRGHGNINGDAF